MGHGDDRGLADGLVLVEDLLDLARVHVVAAADDQLLLAVDDEEVAVLVDLGHVAGLEPAVLVDGLLRLLLALPVALHHVVALDGDLADLALVDLVAVVVDHLHLDALDRGADRAGLALLVGVVERRHRRGLAQAVALEHVAAEGLLEALHDLDGHGRAARRADLERGDVVVLLAVEVEHRREHRRDALEHVDLVALDDLQGVLGIEARDQREHARRRARWRSGRTSGRRSGTAAAPRAARRRSRGRRAPWTPRRSGSCCRG